MEKIFDVIVIGSGPGGYSAAVKAAKEGLRTALVEENRVGGTCLNRGCIPAKSMIYAASLYRKLKDGEKFGLVTSEIAYDYSRILEYKKETINKLCQGVERLLEASGVILIYGKGVLEKNNIVRVISKPVSNS